MTDMAEEIDTQAPSISPSTATCGSAFMEPVVLDPPPTTAEEAINAHHACERARMKERDAAAARITALTLRMKALYHNCMSSACFAREDAEKETDEAESTALRRAAEAYEVCAGWLNHATR